MNTLLPTRISLLATVLAFAIAPVAFAQHIAPLQALSIERTLQSPHVAQSKSAHATLLSSVPTVEYSHGDPSAAEQYLLELINRARADPQAEGVRLATITDSDIRSAYNQFQIDTGSLRTVFATYPSRPPLAFNAKLIAAARRHTNDMHLNNFQSHIGFDGSTFDQRIVQAGYTASQTVAENIFAYARSIWYGHVAFNVDFGNAATLGHRHNIMNFDSNDPVYNEFGAGIVNLNRPPKQDSVGPIIITEEFAKSNDGPFLTGVVFNDVNANGLYDQGEGLAGVRVMPSTGTYFAVTSTSGGYAIPVKTAGSNFTVTFSNGPLATSYTRSVSVDGESVKLDLIPMATPGAVTTLRPVDRGIVASDTARFTWRRPMPGIDRYRLQIATDSLMMSLVYNDSTITDTTRIRMGLVNGTRYFWRVQAHNSAGWGALGVPQSFRVVLLPAAVNLVSPIANGRVLRTDAHFVWNRPAGPVTGYGFELAHDPSMTNMFRSDTTLTDTAITITTMDADRYYWRVRAKNEAGWGPFSEIRIVESATSGVDDSRTTGVVTHASLSVHPNVAGELDMVTANIRTAARGIVLVDLVDPLGRIVATLYNGTPSENDFDVRFSSSARGLHFVRVTTASGIVTAPLKIID